MCFVLSNQRNSHCLCRSGKSQVSLFCLSPCSNSPRAAFPKPAPLCNRPTCRLFPKTYWQTDPNPIPELV